MFHSRWKSSCDHLLGRVVVRHPDALATARWLQLDVIEVGLRFDDRRVALRLEARRDEEDDRTGAAGGCAAGAPAVPHTVTAGSAAAALPGRRRRLGRRGRGGQTSSAASASTVDASRNAFTDLRLRGGPFGRSEFT